MNNTVLWLCINIDPLVYHPDWWLKVFYESSSMLTRLSHAGFFPAYAPESELTDEQFTWYQLPLDYPANEHFFDKTFSHEFIRDSLINTVEQISWTDRLTRLQHIRKPYDPFQKHLAGYANVARYHNLYNAMFPTGLKSWEIAHYYSLDWIFQGLPPAKDLNLDTNNYIHLARALQIFNWEYYVNCVVTNQIYNPRHIVTVYYLIDTDYVSLYDYQYQLRLHIDLAKKKWFYFSWKKVSDLKTLFQFFFRFKPSLLFQSISHKSERWDFDRITSVNKFANWRWLNENEIIAKEIVLNQTKIKDIPEKQFYQESELVKSFFYRNRFTNNDSSNLNFWIPFKRKHEFMSGDWPILSKEKFMLTFKKIPKDWRNGGARHIAWAIWIGDDNQTYEDIVGIKGAQFTNIHKALTFENWFKTGYIKIYRSVNHTRVMHNIAKSFRYKNRFSSNLQKTKIVKFNFFVNWFFKLANLNKTMTPLEYSKKCKEIFNKKSFHFGTIVNPLSLIIPKSNFSEASYSAPRAPSLDPTQNNYYGLNGFLLKGKNKRSFDYSYTSPHSMNPIKNYRIFDHKKNWQKEPYSGSYFRNSVKHDHFKNLFKKMFAMSYGKGIHSMKKKFRERLYKVNVMSRVGPRYTVAKENRVSIYAKQAMFAISKIDSRIISKWMIGVRDDQFLFDYGVPSFKALVKWMDCQSSFEGINRRHSTWEVGDKLKALKKARLLFYPGSSRVRHAWDKPGVPVNSGILPKTNFEENYDDLIDDDPLIEEHADLNYAWSDYFQPNNFICYSALNKDMHNNRYKKSEDWYYEKVGLFKLYKTFVKISNWFINSRVILIGKNLFSWIQKKFN